MLLNYSLEITGYSVHVNEMFVIVVTTCTLSLLNKQQIWSILSINHIEVYTCIIVQLYSVRGCIDACMAYEVYHQVLRIYYSTTHSLNHNYTVYIHSHALTMHMYVLYTQCEYYVLYMITGSIYIPTSFH